MTSPLNNNTASDKVAPDTINPITAHTETDSSDTDKSSGRLASIIERAAKSALARKKTNSSKVTAEVTKNIADIHNSPTKLRLVFLGGGSFGTAMANTAARNGCDTKIWIRDPSVAEEINATHVNKRYLVDYTLEASLRAESDLEKADFQEWILYDYIHFVKYSKISSDIMELFDAYIEFDVNNEFVEIQEI